MIKDLPAHHLELLIPRHLIQDATFGLAQEIQDEYQGQDLLLIWVLLGAGPFAVELTKQLSLLGMEKEIHSDKIQIASYGTGEGMTSTRKPRVTNGLKYPENVAGMPVMLVEDIIDSGHTIRVAEAYLHRFKAKKIEVVSLLSKKERREVEPRSVMRVGIEIPDKFVVGCGIDWKEQYRGMLDLYEVVMD